MNTYTYMKSSEYQHASLMGLDTGIRQLLFSDIAQYSGNHTLAKQLREQASPSMKKVTQVSRTSNFLHFLRL